MNSPTRVLMVAHNGGNFGAERSTLSLAAGLAARSGFEVLVLVPFEGPLARQCREQGLAVSVQPYRQWMRLGGRRITGVAKRALQNFVARRRMLPAVRAFAPDVIYTATGTTPIGAALAQRLGVPHVWHLRELVEEQFGTRYDWGRRLAHRYIARHSDRLIANSKSIAHIFALRLGRDDIDVVYNGFDFSSLPEAGSGEEKYRRCVESAPVVSLLVLGALVPAKGQEWALRAAAELVSRGWRLRLVLAGDGDPAYRQRLQALAAQMGIAGAVAMPGFVANPDTLYQEAALTLICADREAFGRTAVESLGHGTPVIGTQAGGLPEILLPGAMGRLYAPGDWRALADHTEALLRDRDEYQRIAGEGPAAVRRRFSLERYVAAAARVLADAARPPQPSARPLAQSSR